MVQLKTIFVILTIIAALTSGCINFNEPTQKTQLKDEPKVINLNAQQIILNDSEIKEALGFDWENETRKIDGLTKEKDIIVLSDISLTYRNPNRKITAAGIDEITISLLVSPSIYAANNNYQFWNSKLQETGKVIRNKIDVGDMGELYSIVDTENKNVNGGLYLIFKKNNIVFTFISPPEVNVETAFELAKKQEEKIIRILDLIK